MSDTQIKSVALFFFFIFFNEKKALHLTARTLKLVRKKFKPSEIALETLMIQIAQKIGAKESLKYELPPPPQDLEVFSLNDSIHLGTLHALRKRISLEEYSCMLWTKVLGFSETTTALGMSSTIGTIRHRNNTALTTLGQLLPHVSPKDGDALGAT